MTGSDFNAYPSPLGGLFILLLAGLVILGGWKFIEIIIWVCHHVAIHLK